MVAGCATQETRESVPIEPIDISALESRWEGREKKWGNKITLDVFKEESGRAVARHCWGGWCRTTRATYALRNAKITPTSVEFTVGRTFVKYTLDGGTMTALIDPPGTGWDQEVAMERKGEPKR